MMKCLVVGSDLESVKEIQNTLKSYKLRLDYDVLTADASLHLIDPKKYDLIFIGDNSVTTEEIDAKLKTALYLNINSFGKRIPYKNSQGWSYFDTNTVLGIEVVGRNCHVHTTKDVHILKRQSLATVLEQIGDPDLVRCHKSYAVNLRYVVAVKRLRRGLWKIEFSYENDFDCLMGHVYYEEVHKRLYL